jgi:hypothetical protein
VKDPKVHFRSRLFLLPGFRRYSAAVLGNHIFVKGSELPERLRRHEMVHVEQVRRYGILGFYSRYLAHYAVNLWRYRSHHKAYWEIPFEKEARAGEESPPKPPLGSTSANP